MSGSTDAEIRAELLTALRDLNAHMRKLQDILTGYLVPDGYDADEAINKLLYDLDGPEQRRLQKAAFAAIAKAEGHPPMTDPHRQPNLATENAALRAALDVAREEIARLASAVGGGDFPARSRDSLRELALARVGRAARGEKEGG